MLPGAVSRDGHDSLGMCPAPHSNAWLISFRLVATRRPRELNTHATHAACHPDTHTAHHPPALRPLAAVLLMRVMWAV